MQKLCVHMSGGVERFSFRSIVLSSVANLVKHKTTWAPFEQFIKVCFYKIKHFHTAFS